MKQKTLPYLLRLTLVLFLITAVVAGLLGLVNALTADRIAALTKEKQQRAISSVLSAAAYEALPVPEGADNTVAAAYIARNVESTAGWVIEVRPSGFGGELDLMVGVRADGTVSGVSVISHSETSGLGAVAAQNSAKGAAFRDQFIGTGGTLAVRKDGGTIDALTGATVTSRAVTKGVNAALACAALLAEGGSGS